MIHKLSKSFLGFLVLFGLLVGCDTTSSSGGGGNPSALEGVWVRTSGTSTETVTLSAGGAAKLDSVTVAGASMSWKRYEGTWTGSGNTGSITWTSYSTSTDGVTWSDKKAMSDGSYAIEVNGSVGTATVHGEKRSYTKGAPSTVPPVAELVAPTFSVPTGTYSASQSVSIATATIGGVVRYTTDGSAPTSSSALYTEAIAVSATKTIKAVTVKDGKTSPVASVTITIDGGSKPTTANPALIDSWVNADYATLQFQTFDFTSDGKVYRSLQSQTSIESYAGTFTATATTISITWVDARKGTEPANLSSISVPSSTTATYSIADGKLSLTIAGKTTVFTSETEGTVDPVDDPVISPDGGSFSSSQSVRITAQSGAAIYYTTDGSIPTTSSSRYSGAITVATTKTIRAITELDGETSGVVSATITIKSGSTTTPSVVGTWKVDDEPLPYGYVFDAAGNVTILLQYEDEDGAIAYGKVVGAYTLAGDVLSIHMTMQYSSTDGKNWTTPEPISEADSGDSAIVSVTGTSLTLTTLPSDGSKQIGTFTKVTSIF